MFRQIWQRILNLWRQIQRRFRKQPAPPPPKPTLIRSFQEYEQKFMALLEGVEQGWSRGEIKCFLIGCKINDAEWENWLQEFGERLLVSPETNLELGGRMVRLAAANCGKVSELADNIGWQLLTLEYRETKATQAAIEPYNQSVKSANAKRLTEAEFMKVASEMAKEIFELGKGHYFAGDEGKKIFELGKKHYFAGDLIGAYTAYKRALEIETEEATKLDKQGDERFEANDLEAALPLYNKALELDPENDKNGFTLNKVSIILSSLGRHSEVISVNKKLLKLQPYSHWAWNRLGNALNGLGRYSEAISAYREALKIHPMYDHAWSGLINTLNSLGRSSEAIAEYTKALGTYSGMLNYDGLSWNALTNTINSLGSNSKAIAAYEKILEVTGDQNLMAWANRGWAFFNSGSYIEAIQNWDEGLQKYLPSNGDYRLACGGFHRQKGKAHYIHGIKTANDFEFFHQAKASYEQALELFKSPPIPEAYLEVLQELFTVCRSLGDPKANEYLTEANILLGNLILNTTRPKRELELQRKFVKLYQLEVDTLVESGDKVNALEKAEFRKNLCLQWMRAASPNCTASPTYYQIRELLTNNTKTAIIYWHLSPVSLTAFIITPDKFEVIATPVTDIFAKGNSHSLEKWLENWKTNYQDYCEPGKQQSKESHPWRESMTAQLPQLADILKIPEICTHLTNIQHLILIPHRDLHLLPLDALFLPPFFTDAVTDIAVAKAIWPLDTSTTLSDQNCGVLSPSATLRINSVEGSNYLGDSYTRKNQIRSITRLPSAQIAIQQQQQNPTEIAPNSMLMVEHSQGKSGLKFTQIEAAAISQINQTNRTFNATTKNAIIQALKSNSGIFHYAGHAYHNTEKSENSALLLGTGEELTLTDILQLKLVNYYLVCLSACETGITKKGELIDEFVGIASGFLPETNYVISTLWRVDERSSALLLIYFYQLWKQGIQPPAALQQAKDWLRELTNGKLGEWYAGELLPLLREAEFDNIFFFEREASRLQKKLAKIDEKPYEHPYHWAAFTITGNG